MKLTFFNTAVSLVTLLGVHCLANERPTVSQLSEDSNLLPWSKGSIEERKQCKVSWRCKNRNGQCIPMDQECDGDIIKKGIKTKSFKETHVCCAPKQCKPSKRCNAQNGKCIPILQGCNGIIINNGCKKSKSCKKTHVCCAPDPIRTTTTTEAPNDLDILSVDEFISNFEKTYANEEEKNKRIAIFKENVKAMKAQNILYESGKSSFKMGVNEYSDKTYEEVVNEHTGINAADLAGRHTRSDDLYVPTQLGQEPNSIDYRDRGAVNPIRNQGGCGSCWAFSVTSSIESNIFLKGGSLLQLSEQDLVDCSRPYGPLGCRGGWPKTAIEYVIDEGISYRNEYPYTARDDTCKTPATKSTHVTAYKNVRPGSEDEMKNALAQIGPISICMYVSRNFMSYRRGVLLDSECTSGQRWVNHAMTLVGYGTENGQDYWLIRNSWGGSWGDNGYVKVARNKANHCWISSYADIPIIKGCVGGVMIAGQCLLFSTEMLSWNAAKEKCSSQYGTLASLNDPRAFSDYVHSKYGNTVFWLGGSDTSNEGSWVWQNGQPLGNQFPWRQGEPNDHGDGEDCLAKWDDGNSFNDVSCELQYKYVCEKAK